MLGDELYLHLEHSMAEVIIRHLQAQSEVRLELPIRFRRKAHHATYS